MGGGGGVRVVSGGSGGGGGGGDVKVVSAYGPLSHLTHHSQQLGWESRQGPNCQYHCGM